MYRKKLVALGVGVCIMVVMSIFLYRPFKIFFLQSSQSGKLREYPEYLFTWERDYNQTVEQEQQEIRKVLMNKGIRVEASERGFFQYEVAPIWGDWYLFSEIKLMQWTPSQISPDDFDKEDMGYRLYSGLSFNQDFQMSILYNKNKLNQGILLGDINEIEVKSFEWNIQLPNGATFKQVKKERGFTYQFRDKDHKEIKIPVIDGEYFDASKESVTQLIISTDKVETDRINNEYLEFAIQPKILISYNGEFNDAVKLKSGYKSQDKQKVLYYTSHLDYTVTSGGSRKNQTQVSFISEGGSWKVKINGKDYLEIMGREYDKSTQTYLENIKYYQH